MLDFARRTLSKKWTLKVASSVALASANGPTRFVELESWDKFQQFSANHDDFPCAEAVVHLSRLSRHRCCLITKGNGGGDNQTFRRLICRAGGPRCDATSLSGESHFPSWRDHTSCYRNRVVRIDGRITGRHFRFGTRFFRKKLEHARGYVPHMSRGNEHRVEPTCPFVES
jgi:hypothetical protein